MPFLSQPLKKIVVINDLCSIGNISLNVNIPILSSLGYQVIPIASTTLSRHTAFTNAKRINIDASFKTIIENMIASNDQFDAILVGYLGNADQVDYIIDLIKNQVNAKVIIDPVCADNGKLYQGMDTNYVAALKKLIAYANIIIPNITEAYALLDLPLNSPLAHNSIEPLFTALKKITPADIIITGVKAHNKVMCIYNDQQSIHYQANTDINCYIPGTGDIFTSLIAGYYLNYMPISLSVDKAASFIANAILIVKENNYPPLEGIPIHRFLTTLM